MKKPIGNSLNSTADCLISYPAYCCRFYCCGSTSTLIVVVLYQLSCLRDGSISLSTPTFTLALKPINSKADNIYLYYRLYEISASGFYTTMVLSKEVLKARVAAYKEAMEEAAVNAAANAVVGAPPGEPGGRVNLWL